jgi:hypothetical protein
MKTDSSPRNLDRACVADYKWVFIAGYHRPMTCVNTCVCARARACDVTHKQAKWKVAGTCLVLAQVQIKSHQLRMFG